ncbi:hypothetical protein FLONG3_3064 [Fusarium longipes]|uniref:Amine oxidase domain-containing protein n=1 Tax=Fusarium longipes TaxID=694270 RepID=A0A395T3S6_9HYPO|nr:hypothetical protein FLONG3_3064 [Fusarium longipes]
MRPLTTLVVLASCLSTACVALPGKSKSKNVDVDVAIIGGGASGIHAAIGLKDAGASVAVIENKDKIGGHAETYVNPKTKAIANIGVVIFENSKTVQKYFDRLGVESVVRSPLVSDAKTKQYDFSLGIPIPPQDEATTAATQNSLAAALQAYSQNVLAKYTWLDQGYPFVPNPVPAELLQPFGQFAQQNNFTALLPLICQFGWYAGNITTIPTLYGIKKFGPGLLKSVTSGFLVPKSGDARTVYEAAAKELAEEIYLNSHVETVRRNKNGVVVTVKQDGVKITFKARKLLVAIPQTLKNVGTFDLSADERILFSKFSALGYVAGVADIAGVDVNLQNVGALTPANTPVIPGSNGYNIPPGFTNQFLLGVAFDNADYSLEDAKAIIREELTNLARAGAVPADTAKNVTFPILSNHAPFELHVSSKEIGKGFFEDLLKLEGPRSTYWTGAAFTGHSSGLIWNWNDNVILPAMKKELGL